MAEYIERETLFEEIRKEFRPYWQIPCDYEDRVTQKMVTKMRGLIDKLPSADVVEVRHGRWVEEGCGLLVCSKCNFEYDHSGMPFEGLYYCPKCGAKMDGDKNG